ncbi:coiled-coil domain-containing protein [Membranihabitans maritimus]|uniref:coiled-coil domain-containing protein n=1 Tax=Membranihabitans maritimus TaxID=2904244 RepID=UPI001F2C978B|nr:hypothetical protein [Membranihabitans maritimus]
MSTNVMKLSTLIITCFIGSMGYAQEFTERSVDNDNGAGNAFIIYLEDTEGGLAQDVWGEFIRNHNSKVKRIRRSKIEQADEVKITGLPSDVTVKSLFENSKNSSELNLWFINNGEYISSRDTPQYYEPIDAFIDNYMKAIETRKIENAVEEEEDKLKDFEKDLDKLKRDNDRYHKDIEKAEKAIKQAQADIEDNLKEQQSVERQIEEQKRTVSKTKDKLSKVK